MAALAAGAARWTAARTPSVSTAAGSVPLAAAPSVPPVRPLMPTGGDSPGDAPVAGAGDACPPTPHWMPSSRR